MSSDKSSMGVKSKPFPSHFLDAEKQNKKLTNSLTDSNIHKKNNRCPVVEKLEKTWGLTLRSRGRPRRFLPLLYLDRRPPSDRALRIRLNSCFGSLATLKTNRLNIYGVSVICSVGTG